MIEIKSLVKIYEDGANAGVKAVNDISFNVEEGRFYTLLGPSGCGKTTTLRCIAGLEKANGGEILVAGKKVFSALDGTFVPAYRRPIGMVFQSYAIWPHMTVFENVAFPLRVGKQRLSHAEIQKKVSTALEQVELSDYGERMATQLSGGQQQRLALARALAPRTELLIADDVSSALDVTTELELWRALREHGVTVVGSTSKRAALSRADRVVVLIGGRAVAQGSWADLEDRYGHLAG